MDTVIVNNEDTSLPVRDQFAKVVLGASAAFLAGKLVENLYDKFVIARRNNGS